MKILDRKNPINLRQDEGLIIVETAIHRVCYGDSSRLLRRFIASVTAIHRVCYGDSSRLLRRFIASVVLTKQYCVKRSLRDATHSFSVKVCLERVGFFGQNTNSILTTDANIAVR
jgi:hypothetical protein